MVSLPSDLPAVPLSEAQRERRRAVKGLEKLWQESHDPEAWQQTLGEHREPLLGKIQKVARGNQEVEKKLALAWKVRQEFLAKGLHVVTHAQLPVMGLGLVWAEEWAAAQGQPIRSKERLMAPLRARVGRRDARDLKEFKSKFGEAPQEAFIGPYDAQPKIADQLLSVSTEFFNEYALAYWQKGGAKNYLDSVLQESLDSREFTDDFKEHIQNLIKNKIQQMEVAGRVNDLVLIAFPVAIFPQVGYLAKPLGYLRTGDQEEWQEAGVPIPRYIKKEEGKEKQARLVARALQSDPQIESWRLSPLPKAKRLNFRQEMAWIAAYALWADGQKNPPLLAPEEIPQKLCEDRNFLKIHLARQGRFIKYLPFNLQVDPELVEVARKQDPSSTKLPTQLRSLQAAFEEGASAFKEWLKENKDERPLKLFLTHEPEEWQQLAEKVKEDKELFSLLPLAIKLQCMERPEFADVKERMETQMQEEVRSGRCSLALLPFNMRQDSKWVQLAATFPDWLDRLMAESSPLACQDWFKAINSDKEIKRLVVEAFEKDHALFNKIPKSVRKDYIGSFVTKEKLQRGSYSLAVLPLSLSQQIEWVKSAAEYQDNWLMRFITESSETACQEWFQAIATNPEIKALVEQELKRKPSLFRMMPEKARIDYLHVIGRVREWKYIPWTSLTTFTVLNYHMQEVRLSEAVLALEVAGYMLPKSMKKWSKELEVLDKTSDLWKPRCKTLQELYQSCMTDQAFCQQMVKKIGAQRLARFFKRALPQETWQELIQKNAATHPEGAQLAASIAFNYHRKQVPWGWQRWRLRRRMAALKEPELFKVLQMAVEKRTVVEFFRCLPSKRSRLPVRLWEFSQFCQNSPDSKARAYFLHRWHPKLFQIPLTLQKTFGKSPKDLAKQPFQGLQQLVTERPWAAHLVLQALFFQILPLLKTKQEKEAWRQRCFLQPPSLDLLEKFRQASSLEMLIAQGDQLPIN